jgi:tRNA nucleotidyltransferase (CCA-adding enzyme)
MRDEEGGTKKLASEDEQEERLKDIGGYICGVLASDPASFEAAHKLREIGGNVFVVGGAVRDAVLGKEPKDIDLMVTGLEPEKIDSALKELGGKVDVTGKDFGVFRYKNGDGEVEIALPRKEQSTGRGHQDFEVQADPNMRPEEDLWRRDFTVNAMAVDVSNGKLLDPYEGFRDALNGKLRVVNPDALSEDPLRIMRGLAAYARHGLEPTNETLESMKDNAESLNHLPPERIVPELDKILSSPNPAGAFRMAQDSGVLQHFLPEVSAAFGYNQNNPHHEQELGNHLMSVLERVTEKTEDPDVRFAALLHDIGKPGSAWEDPETGSSHFYKKVMDDGTILGANHEELGASMTETLMNRLRFPNDRTKRVSELVNHHMYAPFTSPKGARKFVNRVGDHADDLLHLRWADQGGKSTYPADPNEQFNLETERTLLDEVAQAQAPTAVSQLALNGNDLIAMGMKPGPEIGQTLESLVQRVLDDPTLNERETLLSLVN